MQRLTIAISFLDLEMHFVLGNRIRLFMNSYDNLDLVLLATTAITSSGTIVNNTSNAGVGTNAVGVAAAILKVGSTNPLSGPSLP